MKRHLKSLKTRENNMEIISANERLNADYGAKVMFLGEPGIGKTTQIL